MKSWADIPKQKLQQHLIDQLQTYIHEFVLTYVE